MECDWGQSLKKLALLLVVMLTTSCVASEEMPTAQSEPDQQSTTTEDPSATELGAIEQEESDDTDSDSDSDSGESESDLSVDPPALFFGCDTPEVDTNHSFDGVVRAVDCETDAQTPNPALERSRQASDLAKCEVPDKSSERQRYGNTAMIVGFPRKSHNIDQIGNHKVSVVPVQFEDLSGNQKDLEVHREQVEKFADYYDKVSFGKLNFEIDMHDSWLTLPGVQADYSVTADQYQDSYGDRIVSMREKWMRDGVALADPFMDFSGTRIIIFVLPENQKALELTLQAFYGGDLQYEGQSEEGPIKNLFAIGMPQTDSRMYWAYYAHETGHTLSLPDLYAFNFGAQSEDGNAVGPMSTFDMMSNNWGPTLTMGAWIRWLAGWFDDNQVFCQDFENFESGSFELQPIDNDSNGLKTVMIRTSETEAVIIESRREQQWDEGPTSRKRDGVLVTKIDTTVNHGKGALALQVPEGRGLIYSYADSGGVGSIDATLFLGNSVEVDGLIIEVNETGATDVVSITKK